MRPTGFWSIPTKKMFLRTIDLSTAVLWAALALAGGFIFWPADPSSTSQAEAFERLEGTLFKGHLPVLDQANPAPEKKELRKIRVYIKTAAEFGLDDRTEEFVAVVSKKSEAVAILKSVPKIKRDVSSLDIRAKEKALSLHPLTGPSAKGPGPSALDQTGKFYAQIIDSSDAAFGLSDRFKRGEVVFEARQLCKWKDHYLLRCGVVNEEAEDFFISSIEIFVNGTPRPSQVFIPFSCPSGHEVSGVVEFPAQELAGTSVSVVLSESGKTRRRFEIKNLGYKF